MQHINKITFVILLVVFLNPLYTWGEEMIKAPNVSGQFYDSNPARLSGMISTFFENARVTPSDKNIEAIIAPHAGYVFSGPVAAYSYKAVSKKQYKTIVIIAASHYFSLPGVSIYKEGFFQTPLGDIEVDVEFAKKLINYDSKFVFEPRIFEQEHSLEVQIPFIQSTFKNVKIVPIIIGQPQYETIEKLAKGLNEIIGERSDVLLVLSTDMSHFHDDITARKIDSYTIEAVKEMDAKKIWQECGNRTLELCGYMPTYSGPLT